nr:hypothetical protein [Pseudomonas sp. R76]
MRRIALLLAVLGLLTACDNPPKPPPERAAAITAMPADPALAQLARAPRLIPWRNWSGAQTCLPLARLAPKDLDEAWASPRIRAASASEGFSLEAFDDGVLAMPRPGCWALASYSNAAVTPPRWFDLPDAERIGEGMPQLSSQIEPPSRHSLFWTEGSPRVAPSVWVGEGLPDSETFADMLGGPDVL